MATASTSSAVRAVGAALLSFLLVLALTPALAGAAEPSEGTISPGAPEVLWSGGPMIASTGGATTCTPSNRSNPACDFFDLTVVTEGNAVDLTIGVSSADVGADIDLHVYDAEGVRIGGSTTATAQEEVVIEHAVDGVYTVAMETWLATPDSVYDGYARMALRTDSSAGVQAGPDSVAWQVDPEAAQASVEIPLRVVMVGFEEGEVDQEKVFAEIPDYQRTGSFYLYGQGSARGGDYSDTFGLDTLINHGREYYENSRPSSLLPLEFRWKPELHYAPTEFTRGLFQNMMDNSLTGEWHDERMREFVERYSATRGNLYRGIASGGPGFAVAPGTPVRWFDGEKTEDWIAANSEALLGFEAAKTPGVAGFTVFVMNTWDSPEAVELLPNDEYHNWYVDRPDPDKGGFDGIDWARVWGGRYRFMMIDTAAAPNPYEAESWGNRNRSVNGSAAYDPPLWEYRANAPRPVTQVNVADGMEQALTPGASWDNEQFQYMLARSVNQAVNGRFVHAYLYEPRPGTGRFWLSDNVWHDAKALYESDLELLYDQGTALKGLRTLTPYFEFSGDVVWEYLREGGELYEADQAALDQSKEDGAFAYMETTTMMDYIDSKPDRFLRGGQCYTTVPTIQVAVEGVYAWSLPVIVAGIAENRNGTPWGFLNSVFDTGKWSGADRDESMTMAHPQIFSGTFTYTTIHEASHYLGLAHPHDMLGAVRNEDGSPRYYDGFSWMYNSTASPTTYSHAEIVYSILDQESIARGHTSYYLKWADEGLAEAGVKWIERGVGTVGELPARAQQLRADAIAASLEAEALFADFEFVEATFAAQRSWRAAAAFRDLAFEAEPGTSEFERGTRLVQGAEPAACASAAGAAAPEPVEEPAPEPLPATGGGLAVLGLLALAGAAFASLRFTPVKG